jgi:cytochrome c553
MKGGLVARADRSSSLVARRWATVALLCLGLPLILRGDSAPGNLPPIRIPSYVAWTEETVARASKGDAFRGLLISRRCGHCHGSEGFSSEPIIPNLAGLDRLSTWKQVEDFRSGKRVSRAMQPIAAALSAQNAADVAAYYSMLPTSPDPQDNRAFPQPVSNSAHGEIGLRLIAFGDGQRGIPPCQACHGPIGYLKGAPALSNQNGSYLLNQLKAFSDGSRANDINMPMRSIAARLTDEEKVAVSEYYGAGLGPSTASPAGDH